MAAFEESEYVFCDLQEIYRFIRRDDPGAAKRFLHAAYNTFEFLAENPEIGRPRPEFDHEDLRSWRVRGFHRYLVFYDFTHGRVRIWRVLHGSRDLNPLLDR